MAETEYATELTEEPRPIVSPVAQEAPTLDAPDPVFRLVPGLPSKIGRYDMADKHVETVKHKIWPLQFCHPLDSIIPNRRKNWDRYVHPEGVPYFRHAQKQVVIFCDPFDDGVNECVKSSVAEVKNRMRNHLHLERVQREFPGKFPDVEVQADEWHYGIKEWELFVDVNAATKECRYWIADWGNRCIFWVEDDPEDLHDDDPNCLTTTRLELNAPVSYDNVQTMLTAEFWKHVEYFSEHRPLPEGAFKELKAWFLWATTDRLTGHYKSTIVREAQEMTSFFSLITSQEWDKEYPQKYLTAVVARHWSEIHSDRAHNMFGEQTARATREQSRYFEPHHNIQPNVFARVLSFALLFGQPFSWYTRLCETWIDKTVFLDTWRDMIRDVHQEWSSMGVQATVILASNMGFLTIGDLGKSSTASAQVARTLSVVSTMMSIGSIMCSMLLAHDHRHMIQPSFTLDGAQEYFEDCKKHTLSLFGAAMMYSLPFSMFLWALILFVAAILCFSFATWDSLSSPFTAFFTVIVLLTVVCQTLYFKRGPRKYVGSTWVIGGSSDKSSKVAKPPVPGIEKQATFGSVLISVVRRGSKLIRSLTSLSPRSPTSGRLFSIAASDASGSSTAVGSPNQTPLELEARPQRIRRSCTFSGLQVLAGRAAAPSDLGSQENESYDFVRSGRQPVPWIRRLSGTSARRNRESGRPVLPLINVSGLGRRSNEQSNEQIARPAPAFIPR